MSYILDALKRSEVQRHAGRIPTVAAPHGVLIESPRASRLGVLAWIVVALAVAVGAGWWARRYLDRPVQSAAVSPPTIPVAPATPPNRVENGAAQVSAGLTRRNEAIPRLKLAISLPTREQPAAVLSADPAKPAVPVNPDPRGTGADPRRLSDCSKPIRGLALRRSAARHSPEYAALGGWRLCRR